MTERVKILVPGDNPTQIGGSPHLERLAPYGDLELYADTPERGEEKIARAQGVQVIINTRGWLPGARKCGNCPI